MFYKKHKGLNEVVTITPNKIIDSRGYFFESYKENLFKQNCGNYNFVQENQSFSGIGTLRGLHYQLFKPQGKLVSVIDGEIFDVAVDIRKSSSSFGSWTHEYLSAAKNNQLWIPPGFAHGFLVLSSSAIVSYKCTEYYYPEGDRSILWNDPYISIKWPNITSQYNLSLKDKNAVYFKNAEVFD